MENGLQEPTLTPDTQAVLLLCGRFAPREPIQPLEPAEYNGVVEELRKRQLRPASLLDGTFSEADWVAARVDPKRVAHLLERRMALGLATERWANGGLHVISRSDDAYPRRLREHLGRSAPPLLWSVGDLSIADSDGVAIVGSRDLDDDAARWAAALAAACAQQDLAVVSGGARGVDQIAMAAALEAQGRVIAVLPEGLGRPSVTAKYRDAVLDRRLLLLSPFYPDAGFSVGNAMARNKAIYGLANVAVIVRADANKGGTWAGAIEELRRVNAIPLLVRATEPIAEGNRALIGKGARAFPDDERFDVRSLWNERAPTPAELLATDLVMDRPMATPASAAPAGHDELLDSTHEESSPTTYQTVLPLLRAALLEASTLKHAARALGVDDVRLQEWIDRAVAEGHVEKLAGRIAKYRVKQTTQGSLFGTTE